MEGYRTSSDLAFTPQNLISAVVEFYKHEDKVDIQCHEWLKNCQQSREAWTLVWPLLHTDQILQVQFIAANMLHYKISRQLHEVPLEDYCALKENLLAALARYVNGPSVVLTRLGLTLGIFIANSIGTAWANPLEDLASLFQPGNFPGVSEQIVNKLLIQIFGYVPEQAQANWQNSNRKREAYRQLQSKGQTMFTWLFALAKSESNIEIAKEALRSMVPWMKMMKICEWAELSHLLDILSNFCKDSVRLGDYSLCEICLEMLSGIIADPNTHLYPNTILLILDKILPLFSTLEIILELNDMELATSFYSMYVALADCHSKLIVEICDAESNFNVTNPQNRVNALKLIDILLRCTATPGTYPIDEIVSSITMSVWYSFVEDIQATQSDGLKYARIMHVFEWVYKSLLEVLVKKAQFPLNDTEWSCDEREQFRVYRQDVSDCLTYCYELKGWTMFNQLLDASECLLSSIETKPEEIVGRWTEVESLLMSIRAVTESICDDADAVLLNPMTRALTVILRVLKINQSYRVPKLYQAALECISSCSNMLRIVEPSVKNIIGFVLEGLFIPDSSPSATLTLKAMSRDCTKVLSTFTHEILNACKQALESCTLSQTDSVRLVYCIGKFLPFLPNEQIITVVNEIFSPSLQLLHSIANQEEAKKELTPQLVVILRIMSTLCSSLDQSEEDEDEEGGGEGEEEEEMSGDIGGGGGGESSSSINNNSSQGKGGSSSSKVSSQPLIPVVEQIFPLLLPIVEKWRNEEEVLETLFSILRHTLSTLHSSSPLILDYAIKIILISFSTRPLPPSTNLARQLILMIGKDNLHLQCQFLQEIHSLSKKSLADYRNHLDFVESYFQFISILIRNNVEIINGSAIELESMLCLALDILNYSEAPLLKAGIHFIYVCIDSTYKITPPLTDFFRSRGQAIMNKIMLAIGSLVPRSSVHHFSEVFVGLNKNFPEEWRRWSREALAQDGFPSQHCSLEAKNIFLTRLTKDRANKRMISDAINEFAMACRNMSGSEYGSSTSRRN